MSPKKIMWHKLHWRLVYFVNSSISKRDVITTWVLYRFHQKNHFFKGWSWFKFNNLGLALVMALNFYIKLEKWFKLKVRKFLGANSYVFGSYRKKNNREWGAFCSPSQHPLPHPVLNRVKKTEAKKKDIQKKKLIGAPCEAI